MPMRGQPSMRAASSTSMGTPSMAPFRIQVITGTVNAVFARIRPESVFSSDICEKIAYSGTTSIASGSICVANSPKPMAPLPPKRKRDSA
ncbi:hypothetical protein FQZ97_1193630 [compost metagenome]